MILLPHSIYTIIHFLNYTIFHFNVQIFLIYKDEEDMEASEEDVQVLFSACSSLSRMISLISTETGGTFEDWMSVGALAPLILSNINAMKNPTTAFALRPTSEWIKIQYLEHSTRVTSFDLKNAIVHGLPERNALTGRMEFSTCNVDGLTRAISSAKERAKLLRAAGKYFKAKESVHRVYGKQL